MTQPVRLQAVLDLIDEENGTLPNRQKLYGKRYQPAGAKTSEPRWDAA
jgi:hypothetical protein